MCAIGYYHRRHVEEPLTGLLVKGCAIVGQGREDQVLLMLEAVQLEQIQLQPSAAGGELFEYRDSQRVIGQLEAQGGDRRFPATAAIENMLAQRMGQPIDVGMLWWLDALSLANQPVVPGGHAIYRGSLQVKGQAAVVELGLLRQAVFWSTSRKACRCGRAEPRPCRAERAAGRGSVRRNAQAACSPSPSCGHRYRPPAAYAAR